MPNAFFSEFALRSPSVLLSLASSGESTLREYPRRATPESPSRMYSRYVARIISGFAGSLTIAVPASGTRPTSDRVREALFSALEARDAIA